MGRCDRSRRGRGRRDPRRSHDRSHRRRGPRERGRPVHGRGLRDSRGDQLHGQARSGADLPVAHRRADSRAAPADDGAGPGQHDDVRNRLHDLDRGPSRRHDRHLGRRSRTDDPGRHRRAVAPARPVASGSHLPAARARRRRVAARRTDGGFRRPGAHGRASSGRRDLRDHERRRLDGADAGARGVRPPARPQDRDDRRPHRVPAAPREAGAPSRRSCAADLDRRRVAFVRLRERSRPRGPHGAAERRHRPGR